jgi:hypothetical protein
MHKLVSNKNQINIIIHNEQHKKRASRRKHYTYTEPFINTSNLNTEAQHLTNHLLNKQIEYGNNNQFVNTFGKKLQMLENGMNDNKLRNDNMNENGQKIFNDIYSRFDDYSDTFKKHGSSHPYGTYDEDISIEDLYTNPMQKTNLEEPINLPRQRSRPIDENKIVESSIEPIQSVANTKKYYLSTMNLSQLRNQYELMGGTEDVSKIHRKQQLISKIKELKSRLKSNTRI